MDKQVMISSTYNHPIEAIERMAVAFAKSGLFGIKTPEQGVALMLIAQAEGLHPAIAARDYHVIQGRPALKTDALLSRFQQAGGKTVWGEYSDKAVSGTFSHPQGGSVTVTWTIEQARAAGLTSKDVWRQYPRAMLRARVISEAIRTVYPGVSVGVYTVEEVQDFDAKPETREVEAVQTQSPPLQHLTTPETAGEIKAELFPRFDRKAGFRKLASSGWSKDDLTHFAWSKWGVDSAKDLTDEQLEEFVDIVARPYIDAVNTVGDAAL